METREKLKREIDKLPEKYLERVNNYIETLTKKKSKRIKIKTFNLGGRFDNINMRKSAYE